METSDPLLAVEVQTKAIENYAKFRGIPLERTYGDDGVGGHMPLEARSAGAELVERLGKEEGQELAVVVFRLDRLFSSASECVSYHDAWKLRRIHLHVLDLAGNPVQSNSPAGEFMLSVMRSAQEMERQMTRRGATTRRPREKGVKPLLGERIVRGYVVPDPDELHAVERIEQLAGQGKSLRLIAEALDSEGVPTKRRAKQWSKEAIRLILQRIEKGEVRSLRADRTPVDA